MSDKFSDSVMDLIMGLVVGIIVILVLIELIIEEFWIPLLVIIVVYCIIRYVNYKTR
jgi:multisubunit Na+/H+ antiporter MnhE subunit